MGGDGYRLRGGRQPDVSALANLLANHGVEGPGGEPLPEPLVFVISGGIGAGYHLREFTDDGSKPITLRFRNGWDRPRAWIESTMDRLGVEADVHTTVRSRAAARRLTAELAAANPVLVLPDRHTAGYWRLPESTGGGDAHLVVAYAERGGRVLVDDRNHAPLTVDRETFDRARGRIRAHKNLLVSVRPGAPVNTERTERAVRSGLADCARSFTADAWGDWARLMTDQKARKGWPTVFADRQRLVGALLSVWTSIVPDGPGGGHLRDLFAEGLDAAATSLEWPELAGHARTWHAIAGQWNGLAKVLLGDEQPEFAWMRGLVTRLADGVRAGDAGREATAEAAAGLHRLRAHYDTETPFTEQRAGALFTDIGSRLRDIHARETRAIEALSEVTTR